MPTKKQKGGQFERTLCVQFSKWWTGGEREDVFWRTSGSGNRATSRRRRGEAIVKYQCGDMTFIDDIGRPLIEKFNFEFKFYRHYELLSTLSPTLANHSWLHFWAECCYEARTTERIPFLVTKQNRHIPIVWVPSTLHLELLQHNLHFNPCMLISLVGQEVNTKKFGRFVTEDQKVVGFRLEQFFILVDPAMFGAECARSSTAEQTTLNRTHAGSNPAERQD